MATNIRKCLLCGCNYKFCNNCNSQKLPAWHNLFHDENCQKFWNVLCDFENGYVTKEEARQRIAELETPVIVEVTAQATYDKIFKEDMPTDSVSETVIENIEFAPTEDPVPTVKEEPTHVVEGSAIEGESEHLSVSEELKKHNNNRHNKYNKKN